MEELKKTEIKIEIDEQTSNGAYSNSALISHSETEFVLDFIFVQPQINKMKVRSRIISSPKQAKRLFEALRQNIAKYELKFGTIQLQDNLQNTKPEYFN
jgi:hypothetical protein